MSFDKARYDELDATIHGKLEACFDIALEELLTHQDCHVNEVTLDFLQKQRRLIREMREEQLTILKEA